MAYLLDPGEGKYLLEDLALRYLVARGARRPTPSRGHARLRRRRRRSTRPAAAPRSLLPLADTLAEALEARELTDLYERFERPLVRGARARWRTPASASTVEFLDELRHGARRRSATTLDARDPRARGRGVQRELHAAAAHDPVREARPHAGEEDEDRAVDRRRLAAEDGRRPPDRRGPAALPRGREAAQHLRRRAAAADRAPTAASTRRSSRPTRRPGRISSENAEPPEHARCAPPTVARCAARSSPTTAAGCSPPTTRRSSCACSRTSPRTRG